MAFFASFAKKLVATLVLGGAAVGLGGCGDYALFAIHVKVATPVDTIDSCTFTVTDESGKPVVKEWHYSPCESIQNYTSGDLGTFSYSASRTSGTLSFEIQALDSTSKLLQQATADNVAVAKYPPEIAVNLFMTKQ